MAAEDNEEKLLRSVALKNARSILRAQQRAERELVDAKKALERKTAETRAFSGDDARDVEVYNRVNPGDRRNRRGHRV